MDNASGSRTDQKHEYSFRQIFIASNITIMGIGLIFGALLLTSLYQTQKRSAILRLQNELNRAQSEIDRRFELAELYVTQLTDLSSTLASSDPSAFINGFTQSSRKLLETDPSQYETCLALESDYAKKVAGKNGFLLVISKDRKLVGKENFNDPTTFSTSVFTDGDYLDDPTAIWYHPAKNQNTPYHTPFYYEGTYTQELMTSIGRAITDRKGKIIGVANVDLTADTFSNFLDRIRIGETGGVLVTDSENRPLVPLISADRPILGYHYDPKVMKSENFPLTLPNIKPLKINSGNSATTYDGADGNVYLTVSLPLKYRDWKIFAYQKRSEAYGPVYQSLFSLVAFGLLLLALLIWTAQRVQKVVFASVNAILQNIDANAHRIALEEADVGFQPIPSEGPLEIQRLSSQLNHLYDKLHLALSDLRIARSNAEQATIAKSRFLSVMSHEIRTPLHAMLGMADVLASESKDESQRSHIQVIQRTGRTLQRILNDILDFTRIEAGKLVLDHHEFPIYDLISEVTTLLEPETKSKGLKFKVSPPEKNVIVIGDSLRLKQILLNLLGNAIKFTHRGFVELKVDVKPTEHREFSDILFSVQDSGIGISKDQQERLFSDFTQAENSITRRFGGTGLGLAISRQIVDLLGGKLGVKSELGEGSTFFFEVRFQVRRIEPGEYSSISSRHNPTPEPDFLSQVPKAGSEKTRILLVDDDEDNHALIDAYFKSRTDLSIIHAYNGKEALERFDENPDFALIIMDIQMPEIDGYEVVRTIRSREKTSKQSHKHIPIVMLSANAFDDDRQTSLDAGADAHIGKPIERNAFIETVARWLTQ